MSNVGILPLPSAPPRAEKSEAAPKTAEQTNTREPQFDSLLADKQKPPANADGKSPTPETQTPDRQDSDAPNETPETKSDKDPANLAIAYLLANLPGQILPVEKIA